MPRYSLFIGGRRTKAVHRAHRAAHALRTGTVRINAHRVVGPDVELSGGTRDPFTLG